MHEVADCSCSTLFHISDLGRNQTFMFHFRCEVPDILALELNTTPSLSSCVTSLTPTGLLIKHFVRVDKGGFFHTYPDCGGPFQSLQEAQQAIDSYHVVERKNM
jgi:hypothetical protein